MQIVNAFHRAHDYDRHASVQRVVAGRLAERILALDLPSGARVLEIGCGTGFLGAGLIEHLPYAHYWMTDVAPGMLDQARRRFAGSHRIDFAEMNGADPTISGPFDLICSSLVMQWFPDLPGAVQRLRGMLARDGRLAFTTLASGSFAQWRAAYGDDMPGTPDYPSAEFLRTLGLDVSVETIDHRYRSAHDFLAALKAIGAGTPQPGYRPLQPSLLRAIMNRFDAEGAEVRYVVATCIAGAA